MNVSVVIPNYNGEELLRKNLPFLLEAKHNSSNKIKEIVVVDDKSTDQSLEFLKKNYQSEIKIIAHSKNRRFAAAVNTGVRGASGELICLLNTDVTVTRNFLEKVLPHFKDQNVFAVSLHEKGYGGASGHFRHGYVEHSPAIESAKTQETFWVSGGTGVFRRKVWMQLTGLDEKLFSPFYWEDVDISYRALKRGYKLLWEPAAVVKHEHEATNKTLDDKFRSKVQERNQLIFIWKNITSGPLFRKHIRGLFKRIITYPGYLIIFFMAIARFRVISKSRQREKKESLVSDEAIFEKFK